MAEKSVAIIESYMKYVDDRSDKFWYIAVVRDIMTDQYFCFIIYGRTGGTGTSYKKLFRTFNDARKYFIGKQREKIRKGYNSCPVPSWIYKTYHTISIFENTKTKMETKRKSTNELEDLIFD